MSFGGQTFVHSRQSSKNSQGGSRKMRSRDFKAEYQRLAEQLINVGEAVPESGPIDARILVSENDIHNYHQRMLSQI